MNYNPGDTVQKRNKESVDAIHPGEGLDVAALSVRVKNVELAVDLADGRTITAPVAWFPRLAHGSEAERANWRLMGRGHGIHWPDPDEDVSVESLLTGRRSRERGESLAKWIESRKVR